MKTVCSFHDPQKWGSHVWYILDLMVIRLDPEDPDIVNHVLMQFISLSHTIPCEACREHYNDFLQEHPVPTDSKLSLAKWIYECRSSVNAKLERPNITFDLYLEHLKRVFDCDLQPNRLSKTLYNSLG